MPLAIQITGIFQKGRNLNKKVSECNNYRKVLAGLEFRVLSKIEGCCSFGIARAKFLFSNFLTHFLGELSVKEVYTYIFITNDYLPFLSSLSQDMNPLASSY